MNDSHCGRTTADIRTRSYTSVIRRRNSSDIPYKFEYTSLHHFSFKAKKNQFVFFAVFFAAKCPIGLNHYFLVYLAYYSQATFPSCISIQDIVRIYHSYFQRPLSLLFLTPMGYLKFVHSDPAPVSRLIVQYFLVLNNQYCFIAILMMSRDF